MAKKPTTATATCSLRLLTKLLYQTAKEGHHDKEYRKNKGELEKTQLEAAPTAEDTVVVAAQRAAKTRTFGLEQD